METLSALAAVIAGFAIRLAIPIGITTLAIYFLKRLDARWQHEGEEKLLMPAVEKPKCWEAKDCSTEARQNCAGYRSKQPCWQAFRLENGYLKEPCLGCEVFRKAPAPVHI